DNLQKLTPPKMRMEVIGKHPSELYAGMVATYKVRPVFKLPITWVTEITHVLPKEYFVDEQRFGPFKFWHHEHRFKQTEEGVEITVWTDMSHGLLKQDLVDEQRCDPYKFWHHEHRFKQTEEGVEITDLVHHAMPFSVIGKLVHAQFVRPKLQAMFAYRPKQLK